MFHMEQDTGKLGESLAAQYLESIGFTVLERNYYQTVGEIDIICRKGRTLHFVEVKATAYGSREKLESDDSYGTYLINERIDYEKMQKLQKVIDIYRSERKFYGKHIIDAVFVYIVQCETYAAIDVLEDMESELTKSDDWDFE